jgi:hypothetical protein
MYGSHITRWRRYSLDLVVAFDSLDLESFDLDLVDLVEASLTILVASTSLVDTVPRWY